MKKFISMGVLCLLCLAARPAAADEQAHIPEVHTGEMGLLYSFSHMEDDDAGVDGTQTHKAGLDIGLTERWMTEAKLEIEKEPELSEEAKALAWENLILISRPGEWWIDTGLMLEYEFAFENEDADRLAGKLLMARETGPFLHVLNLSLERGFGGRAEPDENGETAKLRHETEEGAAWSTRWLLDERCEPGFELHSAFSDDVHSLGPVVYGEIGPLSYEIGVLFGVSDAASDAEFKLILEYGVPV